MFQCQQALFTTWSYTEIVGIYKKKNVVRVDKRNKVLQGELIKLLGIGGNCRQGNMIYSGNDFFFFTSGFLKSLSEALKRGRGLGVARRWLWTSRGSPTHSFGIVRTLRANWCNIRMGAPQLLLSVCGSIFDHFCRSELSACPSLSPTFVFPNTPPSQS